MAYHIEQKDIVINGFDQGIADSPYAGLGDMRNINNSSVPSEVSVAFKSIKSSLPTGVSGNITAGANHTLTFDIPSIVGIPTQYMAIQVTVTSGLTGLTNGSIYYVNVVNMVAVQTKAEQTPSKEPVEKLPVEEIITK